jgi:hypothetical protein
MGFETTQTAVTGPGFADTHADGYLKNLHDFVSGLSDWSILLDRSVSPSQQTCTASTGSNEQITCANHGLKTGEIIRFYDTGNGLPSGLSAATDYYADVVDSNTFKAKTEPNYIYTDTDTPDIGDFSSDFGVHRREVFILVSNGTPTDVNDLKPILKFGRHLDDASNYVRCQAYASYDSTNEECIMCWGGAKFAISAAATADYRANDIGLFLVQGDVGGTWYGWGIDGFTPVENLLEDPNTISGTVQNTISSTSNVVVELTNAAEAALFSKGEFYFIYDMNYKDQQGIAAGYGKCNGVGTNDGLNANEIRFETMNRYFDTSGAKVSPYPLLYHTFMAGSKNDGSTETNFRGSSVGTCQLPFHSYDYVEVGNNYSMLNRIHDEKSELYGEIYASHEHGPRGDNDKGLYWCQKPLICEKLDQDGQSSEADRCYGESNNLLITISAVTVIMTSTRTLDGKSYIYIDDHDEVFDDNSQIGSITDVLVSNGD